MNFDSNKKFTLEEIKDFENKINFFDLGYEEREKLLADLNSFFEDKDNNFIYEHRYDYTRLWTLLTWDKLNNYNEEELEKVFERQIVEAVFLGRDVLKELMWFFSLIYYVNISMIAEISAKLKKSFLESKLILGKEGGKDYLLKDLINDFSREDSLPEDNVRRAEFYTKIEKIIFPKEYEDLTDYYINEPTEMIVENFMELVVFFTYMNEKKMYMIVFGFMHAINREEREKNTKIMLQDMQKEINETIKSEPKPIIKKEKQTDLTEKKDIQKNTSEENVKSSKPKNEIKDIKSEQKNVKNMMPKQNKKVDYNLIKMDIEMNFDIDDDANFIDLEGVLSRLEELKNKYNDNKILELYYFDENQDKFVWNDELLNS